VIASDDQGTVVQFYPQSNSFVLSRTR